MTSTNEQSQACCAKCKKTGVTLTSCERCDVMYCSRSCQVAHWKAHKKTCARNRDNKPSAPETSSAASSTSTTGALEAAKPMPFTCLEKGTYLHGRPEAETYQLLIDTYRLRLEDTYKFEGVQEQGSIYASVGNDPLPGFRRFLDEAKAKSGLLPPWWNEDKQKECEELGMSTGWTSLRRKIEKGEVTSHYGDAKFPMQLRMLGEAIYGRGPGGVDGTAMRQMMIMQESESFRGHSSLLDVSGSM